jgi:choline monooxygenase
MDLADFQVHPDIAQAATLPSRFYNDPDTYRLTIDRLFAPSWQFIGDSNLVKVPGAVHPFLFLEGSLNEPVTLTRDVQDELHLISNVCTHRGNLVCEGAGTERFLRCRYHGRRFELTGKFLSMPEFEGVANFPSEADDLPSLKLANWGPLLFGSVGDAPCAEEVLKPAQTRLNWLPLNEFRFAPDRAKEYLVKAHWALYVDNYLEGFHIPFIHAALTQQLSTDGYAYELFDHGVLQLGRGKSGDSCFEIPKSSPDHGENIAAYYYWLFPNTMLNFYPWGLSINVVKPLGPDLTRVSFIPYVWREALIGSGAGAELDRVEREDEAVIELVQRGVKSRFYNQGRYSPTQEVGTHHFHRLIAERIQVGG